jgi:hypothetical protein
MAIKFLSGIDLNQNELISAQVQNLAADPASGVEGQIYFNTASDKLRVYANGSWGDVAPQGDITEVGVRATGNSAVQLSIANATGPIPEFEILTGAVADGQNYLVDSQAVFDAISNSGGGTVTSVDGSGGTTGLTLTGGAITTSGTLTLGGTLIAANGGTGQTGYTVGDILYADSTTTLTKLGVGSNGQVLKVASGVPSWATDQNSGGTVTSIAFGDGLTGGTITGSGSVALDLSGTDNYILVGNNSSGTTFEDGFLIPYSDASNVVQYGRVIDLPFTDNAGTVTGVTSGDANTITIGGTAAAPTVAANTAAVADSGTNLATGDQIHTFVTDFGYTTNTGTVTDVTSGDGIRITGTNTVSPVVSLSYATTANYILASGAATTAVGTDIIAFSDTSSTNKDVVKTALEDIPMAALGAVKTYVDTAVAGASSFQGGYNASTNVPNLDSTPTIDIQQGFQWAVTADGSFFTEQVRVGDLLIANNDSPTTLAEWTTVQGNVDLATTSVAGIASFSSDNFAVSAAGAVTIKNNGVILGTETTGNYVQSITTVGDGLTGGVASEGSTAALSLTLGSIASGTGTDFVMADSGTAGSQYLAPLATAAGSINGELTHAATIAANATVTHNLGTKDVIVQLYDTVTFDTVYADIDRATTNTVGVSFGATPTNDIRVLIQKIG